MSERLTEDQQEVLFRFISTFLPKRGSKRKGTHNEIQFVASTLTRIFNKYFLFPVTPAQVLDAFEALEYTVFVSKSKWDADIKEHVRAKDGSSVNFGGIYGDYDAAFVYIDIHSSTMRLLRLVTSGTPKGAGGEKRMEKDDMLQRILLFRQTVKDKLSEYPKVIVK